MAYRRETVSNLIHFTSSIYVHCSCTHSMYLLGHVAVNSSRCTFITPPHMKLCSAVSVFICRAGYCVWQVLVWRKSVQLAQHKTETSPVFQSWVTRWRQDTEEPVSTIKLSCRSGLAISTNDGPAVPMVTDTHSQMNKTSQYTIPDLFFPVTVSSSTTRISQVGLDFIDPVWSSENPRARGWTQCGEPRLAKGLWRGCQFRMEDSDFQGLAFSSGISPARTYSQQHSGSKWKGASGCGGSEWRNNHHFKTCGPGAPPKSQGCSECEKQNDT